jgi:hypothetical protein
MAFVDDGITIGGDSAEFERSLDAIEVLVDTEIRTASQLHGIDFASAHEAFAVLLEEVEEFKAQVWLKRAHRDRRAMLCELVQIAAMAVKYAAQIDRELRAKASA